jgi:hypothetical protein
VALISDVVVSPWARKRSSRPPSSSIERRWTLRKKQRLSQRVDFVGRFRDGYHVWQVVH